MTPAQGERANRVKTSQKTWDRKVYGVWPIENPAKAQKNFLSLRSNSEERKPNAYMKISEYKSYDDLPLFLNVAMVAKVLGIAPSSSYELMHEADFPVLKVGSRIVVPKEKFIQWVERHTKGGECG